MVATVRVWKQSSPVGELLVATTEIGVCLIEWEGSALAVRRLDAVGTVVEGTVPEVEMALDGYFDSGPSALADLDVDYCLVSGAFREGVLQELHGLADGAITTYGALATAVGRPGAAQAVGQAVASNPIPIVVPCHRVISSDGSLGGFSGGLAVKRALLAHEGFADLPGGWRRVADDPTLPGQLALDL